MKSKLKRLDDESTLDKELERLGVKPYIYHFTDVCPFNVITVASKNKEEWAKLKKAINTAIGMATLGSLMHKGAAGVLLQRVLAGRGLGVAICDPRDQFNRKLGRTKAKGRLIQILLKEESNNK